LWSVPKTSEPAKPVAAGSPRGRFLAVAGHPDLGIRAFSVKALLDGAAARPQVLAGAGLPRKSVAFVRKGDSRGLVIGNRPDRSQPRGEPPLKSGGGDVVFDFDANRLTKQDVEEWQLDVASPGRWRVELPPKGPTRLEVFDGDDAVATITLAPNQKLHQYALL